MGNRAVVVFEHTDQESGAIEYSPAVYLHWNGGAESIYAFLAELERRKVRKYDLSFLTARFIHVVGDYFDQDQADCLSLGVFPPPKSLSPEDLDKLAIALDDNGLYVCSAGAAGKWHVRRFFNPDEEENREMVARERREALKSEQYKAILDKFVELRPKISEYS